MPKFLDDHAKIGRAANIPLKDAEPAPVVSVSPITLAGIPSRAVDLQLRVSAPASLATSPAADTQLPIILLSHGHGFSNNLSSLNGYAPLATFYAARGFIVLQPTHQSSAFLSLPADTPGGPHFWRSRVEDMSAILDRLDEIERAVPFLRGRLDRARVAIVGHSLGGHTAGVLLGTRLRDASEQDPELDIDLRDPRIKAGVLLAPPGNGRDVRPSVAASMPYIAQLDYSSMSTPTLVVAGSIDVPAHFTDARGADWYEDAYRLSPGPKALAVVDGAWHCLGGISGYDSKETREDESPERVAAVQRITLAYLRKELCGEDDVWAETSRGFVETGLGKIEVK
ncbi:Alpha/Beta hydrolase protein [Zopfochytrium polystomum]|nr:Alpha/Beta hydrolase protein [Zopfochytrium polystomum]